MTAVSDHEFYFLTSSEPKIIEKKWKKRKYSSKSCLFDLDVSMTSPKNKIEYILLSWMTLNP